MDITLDNLGKKFNQERVFSKLSYQFTSGEAYALVGHNGSGKSTLLQIIAGYMLPSKGNVSYKEKTAIPVEEIYQHISIATPYMDVIEEFTLVELLKFHFKFKKARGGISIDEIIELTYLSNAKNKFVKHFSSGMKQRLKLALAFFSQSDIILLDEPTSNLDKKGSEWYLEQVEKVKDKLLIIASNEPREYDFCQNLIKMEDFKQA